MWAYYSALAAGHLLALLPFAMLYRISDFLAWSLEHLFHYRRAVIDSNLKGAFPQKSAAQIQALRRRFYRNFSDIILESFKSLRLSEHAMRKRFVLRNPQVFEQLKAKNKGLIMVMGHHTNFEWTAMGIPLVVPQKCYAVYHPLKDRRFNRKVVEVREKFGLKLFRMKDTYPFILNNPEPAPLYLFMADQSPHKGKIKYSTSFLGRETPVHLGVENLARTCDLAVVFIKLRRVKRGYYEVEAELLFEDTTQLPRYTVTDRHVQALEAMIRRDPAQWLWSHKRWKHAP